MTTKSSNWSKTLQREKQISDFSQFLLLTNKLVVATKTFDREENLSLVMTPTLSKDMDEQLKLARKVFDVVDRAKRKIFDSAAVQCGQTMECLRSSPNIYMEKGGGEVSKSCLCEIKTSKLYVFTCCNELCIW